MNRAKRWFVLCTGWLDGDSDEILAATTVVITVTLSLLANGCVGSKCETCEGTLCETCLSGEPPSQDGGQPDVRAGGD